MTQRGTLKKRLFRWLLYVCVAYISILVLLMFFESQLVYPAPRGGSAMASDFDAEDIIFNSSDGTQLHGWYFERHSATSTIVFFHGNAESIERSGPWIGELGSSLNANVFIFDYRGYGKSHGKPFEAGVVQDGKAAIDWLSERTGKSSDQFIYMGRSLGAGVAVQVASDKPPKAFVFISTFSSIVDVASAAYRWLPVRLVMRNRYESAQTIAKIDVPLLQIHGDRDRIIPIELGKKLHAASPSKTKQFLTAANRGHNDLPVELFRSDIVRFLRDLK